MGLKLEGEKRLAGSCAAGLAVVVSRFLPISSAGCWLSCLGEAAVAAAEQVDVLRVAEVVGEGSRAGPQAEAVT